MLSPTIAVWLSIIVIISASRITTDEPVVKIKNGLVKGIILKTVGEEKDYYAFRGIPFAEPPVGNLRFEPPLIKSDWPGILDATKDGEPCIQGGNPTTGSEDCLFVNVYTPTLEKSKELAVMVWFYGGAFVEGTATLEAYGPDYFLDKDVIVVDFNYRVGILGFLSTSDQVIPGNNGLRDQLLALKWVQENIEAFGGDPKKVTIFGGSAGSVSVSYLLQTPLSKGLFAKAIMQSGVSLCLWGLSRSVTEVAFGVAKKLDLEASDTKTLVASLKKLNASYLQEISSSYANERLVSTNPRNGLIYAPVIEPKNEFALLATGSYEQLAKGEFLDIPTIIGFNSLEANIAVSTLIRLYLFQKFDLAQRNLVPIDMNIKNDVDATVVGKKIKTHYFGNKLISQTDFEVKKYITHDMFVRPIREFVRQLSKKSNVYFYRFAYEGGMSGIVNRSSPGASHSEEISYMFKNHWPPTSELDIVTRERLVTMWTNFAKQSDPTPTQNPILNNIMWLPSNVLGNNNFVFLNINKTLSLDVNPEKEDMQFWDDLYKQYATRPLDTY